MKIASSLTLPDPNETIKQMLELADGIIDEDIDKHTASDTVGMAEQGRKLSTMFRMLNEGLTKGNLPLPTAWLPKGQLKYPFCERVIVEATRVITEGGDDTEPDLNLGPIEGPGYVHALKGDIGVVIHNDVTQDNIPTVRFYRTGTATIVGDDEIEFVGIETKPEKTT